MKQRSGIVLGCAVVLSLAACANNAGGMKFDQLTQRQLEQGQARVYFFRDKVFYVVQAPHVVTANVSIDGRQVGRLNNGGFVTMTIPAGRHSFTIWSGTDRRERNADFPCPCYTDWNLDVPTGSNIYFQVWDKTRMEGARAAGGLATGAAVGGVGGAIDSAAGGSNIRAGVVTGAITGGVQDAVAGFRGRVREGESRIWAVDLVGEPDALPLLLNLSLSD